MPYVNKRHVQGQISFSNDLNSLYDSQCGDSFMSECQVCFIQSVTYTGFKLIYKLEIYVRVQVPGQSMHTQNP